MAKEEKKKGKKAAAPTDAAPAGRSRLRDRYEKEIVPALLKELGATNKLEVPKLKKVVVNMTTKEALNNPKILEGLAEQLGQITGQRPVTTRAKKSIATFKLRLGQPIGLMVTLRGDRMYHFVDKLVSIALPRVRDFKGVSPKAFDGRGNYALGLTEQVIFPEIDFDKVERVQGMNIVFETTARNDAEGRALMRELGMPFRKSGKAT